MEKQGLLQSIVNAVVQEEKKRYSRQSLDFFGRYRKQRWYRIMDLIDGLEEENPQEEKPQAETAEK